jgi:Skp family chaperone for outer membrane proteins
MVTALMLFAAAFPIAAKDVSAEQSAVQYARQEFDKAEAAYRVDAAQAAGTRKALESLKKQLEEEQKRASLSEKRKQQAKAKLDKAEEALDRAWKQ